MDTEKQNNEGKMTFDEFYKRYVEKFLPQYYLFFPGKGYIVWRFGTGENVELLHIRAFKTGHGLGRRLIRAMIRELKNNPPYHSVFGFALENNEPAIKMYQKTGFETTSCPFPYKGGPAVIFCQKFDSLCKNLLADDDGDPELMDGVIKSENLK